MPRPHSPERGLDQDALERLYVRLEKPVFNVVYRWLWDADEARDVTQEAFLKLWRMRGRVDPSTVEPLVYRMALNLAANRRRGRRLWRWLGLEAGEERHDLRPGADDQLVSHQERAAVRRAIESLPEALKKVVVLCELSGMKYAEVAQTLGIPPGTVASRRNAAVAKLGLELAPAVEVCDEAR